MSKTWKWILGILLVVVIVAAFAAMGYAWRTHSFAMATYPPQTFERNWNGPMMGRGDNHGQPQMWQRNDGWQHPMMNNRGFSPMSGGFFLLGGLVKLALFFGLLYGAYWLGRRNARITLDPAPAATFAEPSAAPEAAPAIPTTEAETPPAPRGRGKKLA